MTLRSNQDARYFIQVTRVNHYTGGISDGDEIQQKNISKILGLLDEIRDPFAGHSAPAMIGLEYVGELHTI